MRDGHRVLFRISFALVLIAALLAYAYFLYPPLRAQVMDSYHEHITLEKEKDAIAEIMLDPGLISERITDMQGQLRETRPIKGLTPAGVVDDITRNIDKFELELQSIVLGVPEAPGGVAPGGAVSDVPQLLSIPVTIYMKAPYAGGMYFIGSLEKSETGTYKMGKFSLNRTEAPQPDEAADAENVENPHPIFEWVITVYLLYYG
jgi:hypothetical protein